MYEGHSIFPNHEEEKKYIAEIPQLQKDAARLGKGKGKALTLGCEEQEDRQQEQQKVSEEKANCTYLNTISRQNKKKFRGMDVTGVVNVMCDHGIPQGMVDLQVGEQFANTDLALAHTLHCTKHSKGSVPDQVLSYNSQCNYCVHLFNCFSQWFPDLVHLIWDMQFTILAMHVQNHLDMCMYLYASAYKECTGHFHEEGAEGIWAETNALGPAVRQMSNGHRQDVIIKMIMAWATRKVVNMGTYLQSYS